ncbi:MAG: hypothetical protein ACXWDM_04010 [Nocardioides sp.]
MHLFTRTTRLPGRGLAAVALVAALAACAGPAEDDEAASDPGGSNPSASSPTSAPPSESRSASPSKPPRSTPSTETPAGPTLEVTVAGTDVAPNAQEISLTIGEPLTIVFSADRAGELHVHSKPEQYVDFGAGTSRQRLVIETPGTVEIEEHETGAVVAVVEVS